MKASHGLRHFLCIYFLSFGCCSVTPDLLNVSTVAEGNSAGHTELVMLLFMEIHMSPNLPAPVAKKKNKKITWLWEILLLNSPQSFENMLYSIIAKFCL